jgi:hypothetical protein
LERLDLLPEAEMKALITESYRNVRSKLPKAVQASLDRKKTRAQTGPGRTRKKKAARTVRDH